MVMCGMCLGRSKNKTKENKTKTKKTKQRLQRWRKIDEKSAIEDHSRRTGVYGGILYYFSVYMKYQIIKFGKEKER